MDIEAINLNKSFGQTVVLRDLNIRFAQGKRTVIMGDSGCGKTTLLRIIMGLETFDSGELNGVPKKIGVVFQEDRLLENFSAVSNIALAADKGVTKEVILTHLDYVGLHDSALQSVRELSGGMKRRVALVRAILSKKELLLMDEPFNGLDEQTRERIALYIKGHSEGLTTIIVSHDIDEVALLDAELIRMERTVPIKWSANALKYHDAIY